MEDVYDRQNVEIGDDNVIMPNASIMSGARIGNGNTIYNGAVIAATPQAFKYTGDDTCLLYTSCSTRFVD